MPVPIVYRAGGDVQVNYDFADIISGTGFFNLYFAHAYDDTQSDVYFLTRDVGFMSQDVTTENTTLTMDYTLDRPLTISGDVTVNLNFSSTFPSGGTSGDLDVTADLQHWDGSTATSLGTAKSATIPRSSTGTHYHYAGLVIPITTPKHFKKGESIRIVLTPRKTTSPNVQLAHDPADRTAWGSGSNVTAASFVRIPLRIDI